MLMGEYAVTHLLVVDADGEPGRESLLYPGSDASVQRLGER